MTGDLDAMRSRIAELEADNTHLRGMLKISEQESKRPGAAPTVMFDAAPATVTAASSAQENYDVVLDDVGASLVFTNVWLMPDEAAADGASRPIVVAEPGRAQSTQDGSPAA